MVLDIGFLNFLGGIVDWFKKIFGIKKEIEQDTPVQKNVTIVFVNFTEDDLHAYLHFKVHLENIPGGQAKLELLKRIYGGADTALVFSNLVLEDALEQSVHLTVTKSEANMVDILNGETPLVAELNIESLSASTAPFEILATAAEVDVEPPVNTSTCLCGRDMTAEEFLGIILGMRAMDTYRGHPVNTSLFYKSNCPLPASMKEHAVVARELNKVFNKYEINTCLRKAHFLSQVYHESDRMKTTAEYGGPRLRYAPFYGRGLIQLTWEGNYKMYFAHLSKTQGIDLDVNKHADRNKVAADIGLCLDSAGWYWNQGKELSRSNHWTMSSRKIKLTHLEHPPIPKKKIEYQYKNESPKVNYTVDLNHLADLDLYDAITYLINGGFNGYHDREKLLNRVKKVIKYDECKNHQPLSDTHLV